MTPIIVMYTLITKIWNKLGDKTGRLTLKIRLFTKFQREESKKIQSYSIYMYNLIIFKADTPTTIASFMAKPPLMIRADNNERAVPMLEFCIKGFSLFACPF